MERAEGDPDAGVPNERLPRWLVGLIVLLIVQRAIYHLAYLKLDPFALVTISDGQLYENAARDVLAHPPWGTQPLYLQGLTVYLLAAGLALFHHVSGALALQLLAAGMALAGFAFAARRSFGPRAGTLSFAVLLAVPAIAFYENKYLSVSLGLTACMALLWGYARFAAAPSGRLALVFGLCAGLAVLGRPNLLLVLPCAFAALWLALPARAASDLGRARPLAVFAAGVLLALAPLALRNLIVTGTPTVFPSHGGGIPFFIGNNPSANGRWNDAGGLLGGQVLAERGELAQRLGLTDAADPDRAIGAELYRRSWEYIRGEPASWLRLELQKLWYTLGNHSFVRDFDLLGERELLGAAHPIGLSFGIVLGLGTLGLILIVRRTRRRSDDAARVERGLSVLLLGLLGAILAANLFWFTSAQNRAPLFIPLAFASGPALEWLWKAFRTWRSRSAARGDSRMLAAAAVLSALLTAQAFVPRLDPQRPSSVHYYNLANAEEVLGRHEAALAHYTRATEQNPRQPMFWWRRALLARKMGRTSEARLALDRLSALPNAPAVLRDAARREQLSLARP